MQKLATTFLSVRREPVNKILGFIWPYQLHFILQCHPREIGDPVINVIPNHVLDFDRGLLRDLVGDAE